MSASGGIFLTFPSSTGKLLSPCWSGSHRWAPGSAPGRCGRGARSHGPPRRNRPEVPSETAPPLSLLSSSLWSPSCRHFYLLLLLLLLLTTSDSSLQLYKRQDPVKLETLTQWDFRSPLDKIKSLPRKWFMWLCLSQLSSKKHPLILSVILSPWM